jgi:hypothetical protein
MPAKTPVPFLLALLAAPALSPAERFDPESHFPKECFYFQSLHAGRLRLGWPSTPPGSVLAHPGVRKAFAGLEASLLGRLRAAPDAEFERVMGMDLLQFLDLFTGEVASTLSGVDITAGGPRMLFSVELGNKRKEILAVVERLGKAFLDEAGGGQPDTREVHGYKVTVWPARFGPSLEHAVVGGALLFSMGGEIDGAIARFAGKDAPAALRSNPAFARAKAQATLADPWCTVFVNWEAIRNTINAFMAQMGDQGGETARVFAALGLDKLASGFLRAAIRDGDFEAKLFLDSPGGLSGIPGLLAESLGAPAEEGGLARLPVGALELAASSLAAGRLARGVVEALRNGFPQMAGFIGHLIGEFEERTGLSFEKDIAALPRLDVHSFSMQPLIGGYVPDQVAIVRTSEFQPYLVLLDRLARKLGIEVKKVEAGGRDVAYFSAASIYSRLGIPWGAPRQGSQADLEGMPEEMKAYVLPIPGQPDIHVHDSYLVTVAKTPFPEPSFTLAIASIDAEWMVVSTTPQAVGRYLATYSRGPGSAVEDPLATAVRAEAGKGAAWWGFRGGRQFAAAYNTALSLAMAIAPTLEKQLAPLGIDLAHLPPGEELAPAFAHDGFLVFRPAADSLLIHGRAVLSNALASPTLLSQAAAWVLQAALERQAAAGDAQSTGRLRELGVLLKAYADGPGNGAFPHDPAGTVASLQKVADAGLLADPSVLVHPAAGDRPAVAPGADGKLTLRAENVSYELVPWKQGAGDNPSRLLAYDKNPFAKGGRTALFVDLSVRFIPEAEFQQLLAEQLKKYGKQAAGGEPEKAAGDRP